MLRRVAIRGRGLSTLVLTTNGPITLSYRRWTASTGSSTPSSSSPSWKTQNDPTQAPPGTGDDATEATKDPKAVHKFSTNKNVASNIIEEDKKTAELEELDGPTTMQFYPRRFLYNFLFRARRVWFPLVASGTALACLPASAGMVETGIMLAAVAVAQRFIVRGMSSSVLDACMRGAAETYAKAPNRDALLPEELRRTLPLAGQTAVVTGATGSLGSEIAHRLQYLGATVVVSHRPTEKPTVARTECMPDKQVASQMIPFRSYPLDMLDRRSVRNYAAAIKKDFTQVDILVNCAGTFLPSFYYYGSNDEGGKRNSFTTDPHVEINFLAPFILTESLLPLLRRSEHSGVAVAGTQGATVDTRPLQGGRIIYVGCTSHAAVGQKVSARDICTTYDSLKGGPVPKPATEKSATKGGNATPPPPANKYIEALQSLGDEGYIAGPMYSVSKLGNIYHTFSLHDRRFLGITFGKNKADQQMHPYSAAVAMLGPFISHLDDKVSQFEATKGEVARISSEPYKPSLWNRLVGHVKGWIWHKSAAEASQTVLDCCLRPDLVSGGVYSETTEVHVSKKGFGRFVEGCSRKALSLSEKDELIRWAAHQTR